MITFEGELVPNESNEAWYAIDHLTDYGVMDYYNRWWLVGDLTGAYRYTRTYVYRPVKNNYLEFSSFYNEHYLVLRPLVKLMRSPNAQFLLEMKLAAIGRHLDDYRGGPR